MKWTSRDDRAYAETVADHAEAEALLPHIAQALGLEPDQLRIAAVYRARPCRHLRCRLRRWWKRVTR